MKAVANSSVLISLSLIGQLELLDKRFPEGILIPKAVWEEVVEGGRGRPGAKELASISWIKVQKEQIYILQSTGRFRLSQAVIEEALKNVREFE